LSVRPVAFEMSDFSLTYNQLYRIAHVLAIYTNMGKYAIVYTILNNQVYKVRVFG